MEINTLFDLISSHPNIGEVEIEDRPNWGKIVSFEYGGWKLFVCNVWEEQKVLETWVYNNEYSTDSWTEERLVFGDGWKTWTRNQVEEHSSEGSVKPISQFGTTEWDVIRTLLYRYVDLESDKSNQEYKLIVTLLEFYGMLIDGEYSEECKDYMFETEFGVGC